MHWIKVSCASRRKPKTRLLGTKGRFLTSQYGEGAAKAQRWSWDGGSALKELGLVPSLELNEGARGPKNTFKAGGRSHRRLGPSLAHPLPRRNDSPLDLFLCVLHLGSVGTGR